MSLLYLNEIFEDYKEIHRLKAMKRQTEMSGAARDKESTPAVVVVSLPMVVVSPLPPVVVGPGVVVVREGRSPLQP